LSIKKAPAIDAGRTHHPQHQRHPDAQLEHPDDVAEENGVRQHYVRQEGSVEGDRVPANIGLKILLEAAVGEAGTSHFVFAEEKEENARGRTDHGDRPGESGECSGILILKSRAAATCRRQGKVSQSRP
jgi:hypothetical protein